MSDNDPPEYVPMVYIILQLKRTSQNHLRHIGWHTKHGWFPLCSPEQSPLSLCEYQYRTTLDRIDCKACLKAHRALK